MTARRGKTRTLRRPGLAAVAGGALLPLAAHAEMPDRYTLDQYFLQGVPGYGTQLGTTVLSRERPEYDPLGVRVGDFIIRPEVDESLGYNSNVLGQRPAQGSFVDQTSATLSAASDWARNSLAATLNVTNQVYGAFPDQNQTGWSAGLGGTYQIGNGVLTAAVTHLSAFIEPYGIDTVTFNRPGEIYSEPISYSVNDVRVGYAANFGRFTVTPAIDFTNITFGTTTFHGINGFVVPPAMNGTVDGLPENADYLNHDVYQGSVTAKYEYAPLRDVLFVVRGSNIQYTSSNASAFGPSRNGNAVDVLAGLDYTANGVWRYEVLGGYELRQYVNYGSHSAPVFEGQVIWQPSGVTTVTLRGLRTIDDAVDLNVGGFYFTSGRLQVDHEVRRNIIVSAYGAIDHASYLNTGGGEETFYGAGAGLTYLMNRNVHVVVTYDWLDHNGEKGFGPDFLQNVGLVTFKLAL